MEEELKVEPLKMSSEAKEELRKTIIRLKKMGKTTAEVKTLTGAKERHIQLTWKNFLAGGYKAIKAKKTGRPKGSGMKLSKEQQKEIQKIIVDKTPEQLKLKGFLWDRKNIQDLILRKYNLFVPVRTISEYLKRWGFTAQRPTIKNRNQRPAEVEKWLKEEYPAIAKRAKKEKAEIHWLDEVGMQNETNYVKGFAPRGQTPVLPTEPSKKLRINMVSAINNQGKLLFMFYTDKMNQAKLRDFIERLIKTANCKVFLIMDNLPVHHGNDLDDWLKERKTEIEVFFLPSYSPELNPPEYLNGNLKREIAKRPYCKTQEEMQTCAQEIVDAFQSDPAHVASFFDHKDVRYAKY